MSFPAARIIGLSCIAILANLALSAADKPTPFTSARWIWYSAEPMPASINFPAGNAFFRGSFDLPADTRVESASLPILIAALDEHPAEAAAGRPDPLGPGVLFLHDDLTPCWRAASAWALGQIADPAATPTLLRILENLENATDTRHAAAVAIALTAQPADLPALRRLAEEIPEVSVRHAVITACTAIEANR